MNHAGAASKQDQAGEGTRQRDPSSPFAFAVGFFRDPLMRGPLQIQHSCEHVKRRQTMIMHRGSLTGGPQQVLRVCHDKKHMNKSTHFFSLSLYIYIYIYMHTCVDSSMCICACIPYTYMYVHVYVYVYMYIYVYVYNCICLCYVCVCVCVYV